MSPNSPATHRPIVTAVPRPPGRDLPRPLFARLYARAVPQMDIAGLAGLRTELLTGLSGAVVEIGCGNGQNFAHYPPSVTSVRAVEPEPYLRALARDAAASAPVLVSVTPGTAASLPLPDASLDAAVLAMVLCSVADPEAAVAEIARVLRPGGRLVFLEHCASGVRGLRLLQRLADATLWPHLAGGCHTARDPVGTIRAGGFRIETVRSPHYPPRPAGSIVPHVLGSASRD